MTAALSQDTSPQGDRRRQTGLKTLIVCGLLLASSGLTVLAIWPGLDLAVARVFFVAPGHFAGMMPDAQIFRRFAALCPFAIYVGAVLLYLAALTRMVPKRLALSHRSLIFLTLTLALGPGLLVNGLFKAQFHRPRPVHVAEFGGGSTFRPFYRLDGDCPKNCAFPSGESAAAFWTMAPAMLAPPPLRAAALGSAMLFGAATGVARMAAGGHFLSDVLFSGLMMGLLTIGLWFLTWRRQSDSDAVAKRGSKTGLREDLAPL